MNNKIAQYLIFLSTLINNVMACADAHVHCRDGTPTIINMHYVASKASCMPMLSGGGNSLDVTLNFCDKHGGIDNSQIPEAPIDWIKNFFQGKPRDVGPGWNPIY